MLPDPSRGATLRQLHVYAPVPDQLFFLATEVFGLVGRLQNLKLYAHTIPTRGRGPGRGTRACTRSNQVIVTGTHLLNCELCERVHTVLSSVLW